MASMYTRRTQIMRQARSLRMKVERIIETLDEHHRNVTIAKTTGTGATVAGGAAVIAGFALAPFTFGASAVLGIAGGAAAATGAVVTLGAGAVEAIITKCNISEVQEDLEDLQGKVGVYLEIIKAGKFQPDNVRELGTLGIAGAKNTYEVVKAATAGTAGVDVASGLAAGAKLLSKSFVVLNAILLPFNIYEMVKQSVALAEGEGSAATRELSQLCKHLKNIEEGQF